VNYVAANSEKAALVIESRIEIPVLIALLNCREKMFAAVFDPLDRAAQMQTSNWNNDLLRVDYIFAAETAANIRRHHSHLILVTPQHLHQGRTRFMRELRRRPDGQQILVLVEGGKHATPFDRVSSTPVLLKVDFGTSRRACERRVDIAVGLTNLGNDVADLTAASGRRPGCNPLLAVGDDRQRIVFDLHESGSVLRDVTRIRDRDRHRFPDKSHLVLGKGEWSNIGREIFGPKLQGKPLA
jgi:hypothetical protein